MGFILVRNIVLMMLFITLAMAVTESDPETPNVIKRLSRWTVHIANKMETGGVLFLHCKSKDDDLGIHNITYNREFMFRFRVNFWQTTLFWCYFRSSHGEATFDVFWTEIRHTWFERHCYVAYGVGGECVWIAEDGGIYLRNIPSHVNDYKHDWNNTSPPEPEDGGFLSK